MENLLLAIEADAILFKQ